MEKFDTIFHRAANRHGGEDALREKVNAGLSRHEVGEMSDDRWLSQFTKRIFQAGFNWNVVENKWDGFEAAFWNFNIDRCARIDLDDMEKLTSDKRIVRNPRKIQSVPKNAEMIKAMAREKGSANAFIRGWPSEDFQGLLDYINKHGNLLGANTTCYALRFSGVPSYILSRDVTAALIHAGVIDKPATSKTAKKSVQEAFTKWSDAAGEDISWVSRVLAMSIDG